MAKPFRFDPSKGIAAVITGLSAPSNSVTPNRRREQKTRTPGLPPTVRGLPWSKMLRSFREKSS